MTQSCEDGTRKKVECVNSKLMVTGEYVDCNAKRHTLLGQARCKIIVRHVTPEQRYCIQRLNAHKKADLLTESTANFRLVINSRQPR